MKHFSVRQIIVGLIPAVFAFYMAACGGGGDDGKAAEGQKILEELAKRDATIKELQGQLLTSAQNFEASLADIKNQAKACAGQAADFVTASVADANNGQSTSSALSGFLLGQVNKGSDCDLSRFKAAVMTLQNPECPTNTQTTQQMATQTLNFQVGTNPKCGAAYNDPIWKAYIRKQLQDDLRAVAKARGLTDAQTEALLAQLDQSLQRQAFLEQLDPTSRSFVQNLLGTSTTIATTTPTQTTGGTTTIPTGTISITSGSGNGGLATSTTTKGLGTATTTAQNTGGSTVSYSDIVSKNSSTSKGVIRSEELTSLEDLRKARGYGLTSQRN